MCESGPSAKHANELGVQSTFDVPRVSLCDLGDLDVALFVLREVSPYDVVRRAFWHAITHGRCCRRIPDALLPSGCRGVCFPESDAYWIEFGSRERHVGFSESSVAF